MESDEVGDVVTYTYTITNSGNVTLPGPFSVSDDVVGVLTDCATGPLAPGASTTCSTTYTIDQDDLDAGFVTKTATASTVYDEATVTSNVAEATVTAVQGPAFVITKEADVDAIYAAGDVINYTIVLVNSGNTSLTGVTVTDPLPGLSALSCDQAQPATLAPGATLTCTASYTVTLDDIANDGNPAGTGQIQNTVTAETDQTGPETASETVDIVVIQGGEGCTPGYWKQTQHFWAWTGYSPDELFNAVFGVDRSGDDVTLLVALQTGGGGERALGRHAVAALLNAANPDVSYALTEAQVIAMVQAAYASGDFNGVKDQLEFENEQGCPIGREPDPEDPVLSVEKPAPSNADEDGSGDVSVGDTLTYTVTATNDGTANLTNVVVSDPMLTPTGGTTPCVTVASGGICTLIGTYQVTDADAAAGSIVNTATAGSEETDPVEATNTVPVTQPIQVGQGCTPGYWKQSQHFWAWTGYSPEVEPDSFDAVFGVPYDKTLLEALRTGGGKKRALGRHAVAALLNAANSDVNYAFSEAEVISLVQDAWASGKFRQAKNILKAENELGCPL